MDDAVDERDRHVVVEEEFMPAGKVLVGSDDQGTILVHGVNQLKEVVHPLLVQR